MEYFILSAQLASTDFSIRLEIIPEMLLEVSKAVKYKLGQSKKNTDIKVLIKVLRVLQSLFVK